MQVEDKEEGEQERDERKGEVGNRAGHAGEKTGEEGGMESWDRMGERRRCPIKWTI